MRSEMGERDESRVCDSVFLYVMCVQTLHQPHPPRPPPPATILVVLANPNARNTLSAYLELHEQQMLVCVGVGACIQRISKGAVFGVPRLRPAAQTEARRQLRDGFLQRVCRSSKSGERGRGLGAGFLSLVVVTVVAKPTASSSCSSPLAPARRPHLWLARRRSRRPRRTGMSRRAWGSHSAGGTRKTGRRWWPAASSGGEDA